MKEGDSVKELAGEASSLWQASELMKSLISSSYSTKSFSLKWQLVRDKLQQLNSALEAAHNSEDSNENSMLAQLLQSLVSTANEIHELADKCRSGLYSVGKLQMNSDLDVVASELELHVKRLNEIYASGALTLSTALVVSRPCSGARREDVKFYLEDLITRLKVGDLEMKTRALAGINDMLHEDEKHARIMAIEIADAVDVLIRALESKPVRIQEEAAEAISVIVGHGSSYKGILVNAGVISPLVQVAESGSEAGKERVTRALEKLTENSDNSWSVSAHGGVTVMLKILDEVGACVELIGSACGVLRNLSDVKEIKRFMVEHGLVSLLMKLLMRSKEEGCQTKAMEFLHHLASQDGAIKDKVIEGGVVESLLKILNPNSLQSSKTREVALKTIQGLCFSSANSVTGLIQCGLLDNLLCFLRDSEISVQESVLKATFHLCGMSREVKKAMGDAGFMEELVKLLGTKSSGVQEMAAEALRSLVTIPRNQRKFIRQHQNINRVIEELFHQVEEKSVPMKHSLLSILLSLAYSYNGRRKMVETGYVKHLEKLAESGVVDAEKIFKKFSGSRFQSMLNGIWSS
ncbi:hypothetical protein J5N97_027162 [Dioscorea zingiberensis]|uniref:DUF7032 domain-containing protein n=1 Tax=Dioscorea zingiberensis TaxID=325984 RepID=A0A9D5C4C9_9LILI|nr:hypothetical protein J5N97_027162 [Dioscorea zingiberensis]